jgi:hypothetical protein
MTLNQRVVKFMKYVNFTQIDLKNLLKLRTHTPVSNWYNEKENIPDKHLPEIIRRFPDLNARWLITGDGTMLNEGMAVVNDPQPPYNTLESLKEKISSLEKDKEFLQQSLMEALRQKGGCPPGELKGGVEKPGRTG